MSCRHSQNRLFDISVFYLLQKSRRSKQRKSHIIFLSASQSMSVFKFCKLYFLPEFPNSSFEFLLLQFFILLVWGLIAQNTSFPLPKLYQIITETLPAPFMQSTARIDYPRGKIFFCSSFTSSEWIDHLRKWMASCLSHNFGQFVLFVRV